MAASDSLQLMDIPQRSPTLRLVPLSPEVPSSLAGGVWGSQPWGAGRVLEGPAGVGDKGGLRLVVARRTAVAAKRNSACQLSAPDCKFARTFL